MRFFLILGPVVGRKQNDCHVRPDDFPDRTRCLDAVHIGHLIVDNGGEVVVGKLLCSEYFLYGVKAAGDPVALHADFIEPFAGIFTDDFVVIDDQNGQAGQGFNGVLTVAIVHRDRQCESRSLAVFAFDPDVAAHDFGNVFGDRHTQSGALNGLDGHFVCPFEGLEYFFQIPGRHADSVITEDEPVFSKSVFR